MAEDDDDTISHNERFTHFLFPRLVFQQPESWYGLLRWEGATGRIREIWDALGEDIVRTGAGTPVPSAGVNVTCVDQGVLHGATISIPRSTRTTACYFIALMRAERRRWFGLGGSSPPRYFTFERTKDIFDGTPGTMLGGWTPGAHLNFGPCAGESEDVFLAAIGEVFSKRRKLGAMYMTSRFNRSRLPADAVEEPSHT